MNQEIIPNKDPVEVEQDENKSNWKFVIIFSIIYTLVAVGVSFIVSAIVGDYRYTELITAIFGVAILIFMMVRIWFRGSHNLKKEDKSVFEDKKTVSYKNWFRLQICFLIVGISLVLLSQLFFLIFVYLPR